MKIKAIPLFLFIALSASSVLAQGTPPPPKRPAVRPRPSNQPPPARPPGTPVEATKLGEALPGLNAEQLLAFSQGLEEFNNVEDAEGGLGPVFNNVSCVSCHAQGAPGGGGVVTVTRYGRQTKGAFDPLTALGGTLLHQNTIDLGIREEIPAAANVIAHRQSTPLFGLGLMEAIPEATILQNVGRPKPDGIRGKASKVTDVVSGQTKVGRFGWKAQQATILAFAGDAYLNEMGITSRLFPEDTAPNGNKALLATYDKVQDPEDQVDPATGKGDIDHAADFMRFLAPPPALPLSASAVAGKRVFHQLNCNVCHTPAMVTGPNAIAALNQKTVALYSDLLLHDMGSLGDGIVQGTAGARDLRTTPLWGTRFTAPYLHDGRAATLDEAIKAHAGEGAAASDRYKRLQPKEQQQLVDFLNTI